MNDPRLYVCSLSDYGGEYIGDAFTCYIARPLVGEIIQFEKALGRIPHSAWVVRAVVHAVPRRGIDLHVLVEPVKKVTL